MDRNAPPETFVRRLAENAARIEAVERILSPAQLVATPEPGGWSPNEILWHIRATDDVYREHIKRILEEDGPGWRHVSPRARMKKSRYDQLPFAESFAEFARQRRELISLLESISPEAWQRIAVVRVPHRQLDWRLTLHVRVWGLADHEAGHCAQIEKAADALRSPR
jgi:hypothetical protein